LKTDYTIDSIEHHLNNALDIEGETVSNPIASNAIDRTLETSIDTTLSPLSRTSEEVSHYGGNVKSRVKRIVKRKLTNRGKRPPTDRWRLNDTEFEQLHTIYKFIAEGFCEVLG
jgi:hypothetical protein